MTFPKFVEKYRKITDFRPKMWVFGDFRVKTWLFLRFVNFLKVPLISGTARPMELKFGIRFPRVVVTIVMHGFFHFSAIFGRVNVIHGVNWSKFHGF